MLAYPDQDERSAEIRNRFGDELRVAEGVFDFWLKLKKDKWLKRSRLSWRVKHVAMLLNMQACRQFRSVVELCKISEAFNASIIARSLYETALATYFVLKS